jgi:hypothetical protein
VVLNGAGGILAYGRARRLAAPGQRLALMARDKGCSFPRCRETASRSEVHHITDWAKGGTTDIDNQTLACPYHNNEAPRQDWYAIMIEASHTGSRHPISTPSENPNATACTAGRASTQAETGAPLPGRRSVRLRWSRARASIRSRSECCGASARAARAGRCVSRP